MNEVWGGLRSNCHEFSAISVLSKGHFIFLLFFLIFLLFILLKNVLKQQVHHTSQMNYYTSLFWQSILHQHVSSNVCVKQIKQKHTMKKKQRKE